MVKKLVPLSAFDVYGLNIYNGRRYETVDGEIYVPVYVGDKDVDEALLPVITGERCEVNPFDDMAEYNTYYESWIKYVEEDEVAKIDDSQELAHLIRQREESGVGLIYNQMANQNNGLERWCVFKDPFIHDEGYTALSGFASDRELFLRRFCPHVWADLTVKGILSQHCNEVAKYANEHMDRLKHKFSDKFSEQTYSEDAKFYIVHATMENFEKVQYFGEVKSRLELIAEGVTPEDILV